VSCVPAALIPIPAVSPGTLSVTAALMTLILIWRRAARRRQGTAS
jgi:hypothetical protein